MEIVNVVNEALETARGAFLAATERADKMACDAAEDVAKVEEARRQCADILERLGAGEEGIHRASYTQLAETVRQRELAAKLSGPMAKGARKRADEAEIRFLAERAKDFRLRRDAAKEKVLERSIRADRSLAKVNDDLDDLASAERDLANIVFESQQFNAQLQVIATGDGNQRANECLKPLHPSEWPKVNLSRFDCAQQPTRLRVELVQSQTGHRLPVSGVFDAIIKSTAEQHVRNAHGIPLPPPPPPAAQLEPADEEPAAQFAVAAE